MAGHHWLISWFQVFEDAKTRYLVFAKNGTVKSNTIAILAIITRLRQACLHPSLLLKAGGKEGDPAGQLVRRMVSKWVAKYSSGEHDEDEVMAEANDDEEDVYQSVCMLCESVSDLLRCSLSAANLPTALRRSRLLPLRTQRMQRLHAQLLERCQRWQGAEFLKSVIADIDFGMQAQCPSCEDGKTYTQQDLHQAVKQEDGDVGGADDAIELSSSSEDEGQDRKNPASKSSRPLFRARSNSEYVLAISIGRLTLSNIAQVDCSLA